MAEDSQLQELLEELIDVDFTDFQRRNEILQQISQFPVNELRENKESLFENLQACLKQSNTALKATQIYTDFITVIEGSDKKQAEDDLSLVVLNLGDSDAQTRKYSHMLLLSWVKKQNDLNSVMRAFLKSGFSSQNTTIRQKSINSFQGIILTEARAIDWNSKEIFRVISDLLNIWQKEVHTNVQKAADHALVSLCKRDEMRVAVTKLDIQQMKIIKQIAEKHLILGLLPEEIENSSQILIKHKQEQGQQTINSTLGSTQTQQNTQQYPYSQQNKNSNQNDQVFQDLLNQSSRNNGLQSRKINREIEEEQVPKQKNQNNVQTNSTHKLSYQEEPQKKQSYTGYQAKSEGFILTDLNKKLHFGFLNQKQYNDLKSQKDWRAKAQAVEELENNIKEGQDLSGVEEELEEFLDLIIDLTSDTNFKVQVSSLDIILSIIGLQRFKEENIFRTLSDSIIEKLGDSKVVIRQLAQKIILKHFNEFDQNEWINVTVQNLKSKSAQLKEDSLGLLETLIIEYNTKKLENEIGDDDDSNNSDENLTQNSRLAKQQKRNIKKTKKLHFDWKKITKELAILLDDPKDKIKSKCLDCFIQIKTTLNDQDQFVDHLKYILTRDQENKVLRAIGTPVQPNKSIQTRQEKSGTMSKGFDYSNYQYIDPEGSMHFSFANLKKNEETKYFPSSANTNSLNRSINRQFQPSPDLPRQTNESSKGMNDFKINAYNVLDTKGGRYGNSNQQSVSAIEDASTTYGSSIQQTPNQPDSNKKTSFMNNQKDCLDYLGDKRSTNKPNHFGSAGKNQKSTFEVAFEQQVQLDKRISSATNPDRNNPYNSQEITSKELISPQPKRTMKTNINTGDANVYTNEEDLEPLRNPDNAVNTVLNELKISDWERQFKALDIVRRLIKFHDEVLARSQNFPNIVKEVNQLIDNLRSNLAKNAMMTISEMAVKLKKHVEVQIEGTFAKLMKKGNDANVFILEEVKKALVSICSNCSPQKILSNCLSINTKSQQSKQYIVQCFDTLILVHQEKLLQVKDFDKIVEYIGNFVIDSSQEVRNCAKVALQNLNYNCIDKNKIKSILMRTKDENTANKIISAIDSFSRGNLESTLGATGRSTSSMYGKSSRSILLKSAKNNMNSRPLFSQQSSSSNNNLDLLDTYSNTEQVNNISPEKINLTKFQSQQQPPHLIAPKPTKSTSISRIQRSPDAFENLPTYFQNAENHDWNTRLISLNDLEKIATNYPKELTSNKHYIKFLDTFSKLNMDANLKVQLKSLEVFQNLVPILSDTISQNIQAVMNSVFTSCGSQNIQIKRQAEEVFDTIMDNIDSQYLFESLNNGSQFANPKSKALIIEKLAGICNEVSKRKQNIFHKSISKTIQKLLQENKTELKQSLKMLIVEVYYILEDDLFIGPLASHKQQIIELIE